MDKPGIVAAVAGDLAQSGCNIVESAQFFDPHSGRFYMRVLFSGDHKAFSARFGETAPQHGIDWRLHGADEKVRTILMVSKADHALRDLLYRRGKGDLGIDIAAIVSNHDLLRGEADQAGLPFHHIPVTPATKAQAEAQLSALIAESGAELIVLARYMQILSDDFCAQHESRIINIHHSFLPGFKGARPYHQAYERGVKLIGATAHFASADLDEGPIIAQDVLPVDHRHTPEMMQQAGRDTESRVLAEAVRLYTERRIFLNGRRTVIL